MVARYNLDSCTIQHHTVDVSPLDDIQRALIMFSRSSKLQARAIGMSFVTTTILSYVASTPEPHATGLADDYGLDKSTVSRQLGVLEDQGLIRRVPHATRARSQLLKLTAKGRRVLASAIANHRERLGESLGAWPEADLVAFSRLLSRFVLDLDRTDVAKSTQPELEPTS
jgi:DNA-binding MarR family transcriptional regulator